MATKPQLRGLTYQDIVDLPEERRELLDGELFVTPSPATRHQEVVGELYHQLRLHLGEQPGKVFVAPLDVLFSDTNVLQPDIMFVTEERLPRIEKNFVRSAPDLVIEVSSPSRRRLELVRKRELYERFGVPEFWYVDLEADRVEVYRIEGDRYAAPAIIDRTGSLDSPFLPGFSLAVDDLLGPPERDAS